MPNINTLLKLCLYISLISILFLATTTKEIETIKHTWDKLNHILAFITLYMILSFAYKNLNTNLKFILLLFFGIFIEIVQYFIPSRDFSFYDIVAYFIGVFIGYLLYKFTLILKLNNQKN